MDRKSLAAAAAVALGMTIAGCGNKESGKPAATPASAVPGATSGQLPAQHPPLTPELAKDLAQQQAAQAEARGTQGAAPPPRQAREGKVQVDPTQKFTQFLVGEKNVKTIYVDGKLVWIGTSGGTIRYDSSDDSYKIFDASNGLLSNGAFFVGKIKGKITVGTYGGGVSMLNEDGRTWKNYNIPDGVGDSFIYKVMEAKNGDIWIATWSGVNRVRGGALDETDKWELYTVENTKGGLPNDWVYSLEEGKDGVIWLATEGGVARFANGKWDNWNHAKGVGAPFEKVKESTAFKSDPGKASEHHARQKQEMGLQGVDVAYNANYIVALAVDRDGMPWAGTWGGGLSHFDGKRWTTYTTAEGLPGNHVFSLHTDRDGNLWVGTNKGVVQWKDGKPVGAVLTAADGLVADNVFSMATTPEGGKWIGSYGGVAYLRPAK
jgi:ligand-binding sensor domain-containing protein